jgi:hypothetical protein
VRRRGWMPCMGLLTYRHHTPGSALAGCRLEATRVGQRAASMVQPPVPHTTAHHPTLNSYPQQRPLLTVAGLSRFLAPLTSVEAFPAPRTSGCIVARLASSSVEVAAVPAVVVAPMAGLDSYRLGHLRQGSRRSSQYWWIDVRRYIPAAHC